MNLLHVTPYYAPAYAFGGVVRAVEGLARALVGRGHQVTVLTTDALDPRHRYEGPADEMMDGVRVLRVPNRVVRGSLNLSTPRGMRAAARELVAWADLVHCHEFRTVENLAVTPFAAHAGVPLLLSPHGTLPRSTGRGGVKAAWDALFSKRMARRFGCVVALTAQEAQDARALWESWGAHETRFVVVPNGVDPNEFADNPLRAAFREQYGIEPDAPTCLFLGRLHPRKGPHVLAQAFRQVAVPDARLVVAGPDEGALGMVNLYADDRVVVTGYLDAEGRRAAFAAADLFALPAVGEGQSIAVFEAMAAGLPVLISPGCHLPEVVAAGAGVEVEVEPLPLAQAMTDLLQDAARRRAMGAAARALIESRYTWTAVAEQMERVYDDLVVARSP